MRIPFANRTADVDLPAVPGQPKVTIKSVIDDFRAQLPSNFEMLFEAFVLLSPRKVRVTCRTPRALEEVQHLGLAYRNSAVTFHPCRTARWVNVTRLSYGVPNEAIQAALSPYGKVLNIKMDSYQGVYVGVRNVLMEISTPIPSNVRIADHWCNVFYQGQVPTCFKCRRSGHTRAKCPQVAEVVVVPAVDAAAAAAPVLLSPARQDVVAELVDSVLNRVLSGQATFAEVVASGVVSGTSDAPVSEIENVLCGDQPGPNLVDGAGSVEVDSQDVTDLAQDLFHSSSASGDSDDDEIWEDAQHIDDGPCKGKRAHSSGTSSDESEEGLSPAHKKGKEIQAGLLNLQCPQGESEALEVEAAAEVPLPLDDDEFKTELDLKTDTSLDSAIDKEPSSEMDVPSVKPPKPTMCRGTKSQPAAEFRSCYRTRTTPPPVHSGRSSSQPLSRGSNR